MTRGVMASLTPGRMVKFKSEKGAYTVRAAGVRYVVCTKPYNPKRTVIYSVVDMQKDVRGTEGLVFGMGAETDEQCRWMLERLESGFSDVSRRNRVRLDIEAVYDAPLRRKR